MDFSPNILVFGTNPSFPTTLNNRIPANNPLTISKYLSDNLNALHSAREHFIKQEASEKLSRALARKTRTYSDIGYFLGDVVYYYRDSSSFWHGPAKIIGKDGKNYLLKQGGAYIRVHPCKLQLVSKSDSLSIEKDCDTDFSDPILNLKDGAPAAPNNTVFDSDSDTSNTELVNEESSHDVSSFRNKITVSSTKDLPKIGSSVHFRSPSQTDWRFCEVISRGGKAKGANWHFLNIKEGDEEKCISFKNVIWKN